jgi:asparagine synthase (glutamine-hydrolysing)
VCGIAGVWSNSLADTQRRQLLDQMAARLAFRGPDSVSIVEQEGLSLAFFRLHIVGSAGPAQPVRCGPLLCAVNGEIYNHRQLWESIPAEFRGQAEPSSDCSVVAPLARQHGMACLTRLDGIFAGVLLDSAGGKLTLFRDHVGVKPMYYAQRGDTVAFASTVSALIPVVGKTINRSAMRDYLVNGYVSGRHALLSGVKKVPAGCRIEFSSPASMPQMRRWFHLTGPTPDVRASVMDAVLTELPHEGPVVSTLSGGIDSTLVTLLAARAGVNPIALTATYPELVDDDDLVAARQVAKEFGLRHETVIVTADDYLSEIQAGWRFDQPLADPNAIALNRICRRVTELGSRVILTGDGSDELFGGYPYYRAALKLMPRRMMAAWTFSSMSDRQDRAFAQFITGRPVFPPIRPTLREPLRVMQERDLSGWLEPNLLEKADRFGMAEQVEVRVPFLRPAVVKAALDLPASAKIDGHSGTGKLALRAAFGEIIPAYVLQRDKRGFACPLSEWLRSGFGHVLREAATYAVADAWDLRREQILWDQHLAGHADWGQQLWRLAVARSWWTAQ